MSINDLTAKVKELKELQALIDEAAVEAESIKDELKAHMDSAATEELTVDVFKLRYQTVVSNRFDSTAFKAKYGELYTAYLKPTTSRRFTVA